MKIKRLTAILYVSVLCFALFIGVLKYHETKKDSIVSDKDKIDMDSYLRVHEYKDSDKNYEALGHTFFGMSDYEQALENFLKAENYKGIADSYFALGDYDMAIEYYRKINSLKGLADCYFMKGEYSEAVKYFEEAGDKRGLANAYFGIRRYDDALEYFSKAKNYEGLGDVYFMTNQFDKAFENFRKAYDKEGEARLMAELKQYDESFKMYDEIGNFKGALKSLKDKGDVAGAVNYCSKIASKGKLDPEISIELGDLYYEMGRKEKAFAELKKVSGNEKCAAKALMYKARIYYREEQYDLALETFKEVVDKYPESKWAKTAKKCIEDINNLNKLVRKD